MTRTHIAALLVLAVAVPAAIAGSFNASNDAPCFVAGNAGYRKSDNASANITVRIDNAAAKPRPARAADRRFGRRRFRAARRWHRRRCLPRRHRDPEASASIPTAANRRPHGDAVARARRLQDLRALGRLLAAGRRRACSPRSGGRRKAAAFRTRVRRPQLMQLPLARLNVPFTTSRDAAARPGIKLQRSRRQMPDQLRGSGRRTMGSNRRTRSCDKRATARATRRRWCCSAAPSWPPWRSSPAGSASSPACACRAANYDPYAYGTGVGALFAAACAVIAFMLMRQRTHKEKMRALEARIEELTDDNWELREVEVNTLREGARPGGSRQPRQVAFPRHGQPRNPHAAQRHSRHGRSAARHAAHARAGHLCQGGQRPRAKPCCR